MALIDQKKASLITKLTREFGPEIMTPLDDPDVIEIMVNPDGRLWLDTFTQGMRATDVVMPPTQVAMILGTVAAFHDQVITADLPKIQAALPLHGERFQGLRLPVCAPSFVIRKHVPRAFSLRQLFSQDTLTGTQYTLLLDAIAEEKNILIAGATLSGKTVLLDAVLHEMPLIHGKHLRVVVIEDTTELHVEAENRVQLRATETVSIQQLVHTAMRLRPDRLIIGEVRGAEALDMLKSWATGHGGSACTIHAGTPERALARLKGAVQEARVVPDMELIGEVVDRIVMMRRVGPGQWACDQIVACDGWHNGQFVLHRLDAPRTNKGKEAVYDNGIAPH